MTDIVVFCTVLATFADFAVIIVDNFSSSSFVLFHKQNIDNIQTSLVDLVLDTC